MAVLLNRQDHNTQRRGLERLPGGSVGSTSGPCALTCTLRNGGKTPGVGNAG